MHVIDPSKQQYVHVSQVTKTQLAREVNRQTGVIKQLDEHVKILGKALIAITLMPEAFSYQDGVVAIDREALARVKAGMSLTFDAQPTRIALGVTQPPVVDEVTPQIVIPDSEAVN